MTDADPVRPVGRRRRPGTHPTVDRVTAETANSLLEIP
jgi:hypothetical protein